MQKNQPSPRVVATVGAGVGSVPEEVAVGAGVSAVEGAGVVAVAGVDGFVGGRVNAKRVILLAQRIIGATFALCRSRFARETGRWHIAIQHNVFVGPPKTAVDPRH